MNNKIDHAGQAWISSSRPLEVIAVVSCLFLSRRTNYALHSVFLIDRQTVDKQNASAAIVLISKITKGGRFVNHRIRIFLADSVLFSFYYSTPQFRQKSQLDDNWQLNSTLGHKYLIMSPRREINHIVKYRKADTTPDSYSTRHAERNKETPFAEGAKSHQATPREILHKLHNSSCRNLSQSE